MSYLGFGVDGQYWDWDNAIWITQKNYVDYKKDLLSFGLPVKEYNKGDGKILVVRDKIWSCVWFLDNLPL